MGGTIGVLLGATLLIAARPLEFHSVASLESGGLQYATALASTRRHIAVGASGDSSHGRVVLYDGATFQEIRRVSVSGSHELDQFGTTIASVGDDFLVGAPFLGAVYRIGTDGAFEQTFLRPNRPATSINPDQAEFGDSIAASGGRLFATARPPFEEFAPGEAPHSTLYGFDAQTGDLLWETPIPGDCNRQSVVAHGRLVAVSSGCGHTASRRVLVFSVRDGRLRRTILPPEQETAALFGISLSLGKVLLVGAPADRGGAAYAFHPRTGKLLRAYRLPAEWANAQFQFFGYPVLTGDSWVAATDSADHGGTGAVYLFDRRTGAYHQQLKNRSDGSEYGNALGRFGRMLLVGSEGNPHGGYVDLLSAD